jgi:ABC-type transporter Mla subunit MlaD
MRKPVSPWSVRGVGQEARALAAKAAGRQRMYLGEWVTHAITETANAELCDSPRAEATPGVVASVTPSALDRAARDLQVQVDRSREAAEKLSAVAERIGTEQSSAADIATIARHIHSQDDRDQKVVEFAECLVENAKKTETQLDLLAQSLGFILHRMREVQGAEAKDGQEPNHATDRRLEMLADLIVRLKSRQEAAAAKPSGVGDGNVGSPAAETMEPVNGETITPPPIYNPNFDFQTENPPKPGFWSRLFGSN